MSGVQLESASTTLPTTSKTTSQTNSATCDYFMYKFRRNCRDLPAENSTRCEFHFGKEVEKRERIACPFDPSHDVWSDNLNSHLKKCNKFLEKQFEEMAPCYSKNCNVRKSDIVLDSEEPEESDKSEDKLSDEEKQAFCSYFDKFFEISEGVLDVKNVVLDRSIVPFDKTTERGRHKYQLKQILAAYEKHGFFNSFENQFTIFLEYGCGKAKLTQAVQEYVKRNHSEPGISEPTDSEHSQSKKICINPEEKNPDENQTTKVKYSNLNLAYILVEREARRHKAEDKGKTVRLRLDLLDFNFKQLFTEKVVLPELNERLTLQNKTRLKSSYLQIANIQEKIKHSKNSKSIVQAKHLCGSATDLAMQTLENAANSLKHDSKHNFGFGIATCCHHRCDWDNYTGKDFITILADKIDVVSAQKLFCALRSIGAWATLTNEHESPETILKQKRGAQAKKLLDYGRLFYAGKTLNLGNLFYIDYCDFEITPERFLILAY